MKNLLLAGLLVGCSSMPDVKVEGVDNLLVSEYILQDKEAVKDTCSYFLAMSGFFPKALACAVVSLDQWTCDIFYSLDGLKSYPDLLEHERLHCKGYWHDAGLQQFYDDWRAKKK